MPITPGQDPNEAYDIGHLPAREHDLPPDWRTVFCNGIPVHHCSPSRRDLALGNLRQMRRSLRAVLSGVVSANVNASLRLATSNGDAQEERHA